MSSPFGSAANVENITMDIHRSSENREISHGLPSSSDAKVDIGLELLTNKKKTLPEDKTKNEYNPSDTYQHEEVNEFRQSEEPVLTAVPEELSNQNNQDFYFPSAARKDDDARSRGSRHSPKYGGSSFFERPKSSEEKLQEKKALLFKLDELIKRSRAPPKTVNLSSSLEEIQYELEKLKKSRDTLASIKFSRKMLMAFVTALEFLNKRFDPFDVKLDGWSESMHENLEDYDDVFEELYEKYQDAAEVAPEIRLMLMVGGSAFMFHLTNTMFKSSLPGMGDIMKQNPELMKQFAQAALHSMNPASGNMPPEPMGHRPEPSSTPFASSMFNEVPEPMSERTMRGPIGVDDIISELQNELPDEADTLQTSPEKRRRRRRRRRREDALIIDNHLI